MREAACGRIIQQHQMWRLEHITNHTTRRNTTTSGRAGYRIPGRESSVTAERRVCGRSRRDLIQSNHFIGENRLGNQSQGVSTDVMCPAWPQSYDRTPSHPHNAGTEEHVFGFSWTRQQTLLAPSAKRREVLGESHEGCVSYILRRTAFDADSLAHG